MKFPGEMKWPTLPMHVQSLSSKPMKTADPFYLSLEWRSLRAATLKRDRYRCTQCATPIHGKGQARVDHIVTRRANPALALDPNNVRSLCVPCDAKRHREKGNPRHDFTSACDQQGNPTDPLHPWASPGRGTHTKANTKMGFGRQHWGDGGDGGGIGTYSASPQNRPRKSKINGNW
jgi:5-methylcytosine-specific restriction protein A